jgi:hypothetical protein
MSAGSNILWAGLGVAAGYALALYIDQLVDDQEDVGDDDREVDAPDLRVVDGGAERQRSRVSDEDLDSLLSDDD